MNINKKVININNLVKSFTNITYLINFCKERDYDEVWIIGGSKIYDIFLNSNDYLIDEIYITYFLIITKRKEM
jgi:dihydrofolate reductase